MNFVVGLAKDSDPVKGGALLRRGFGALEESMRREAQRLHPDLASGRSLKAYQAYFDDWYEKHGYEVRARRKEIDGEILQHGDRLLALTERVVGEPWPSLTIQVAISVLPPNAAWAGTSNIDLYIHEPNPLPILLHELLHVHIEHAEFGNTLRLLSSKHRWIVMEVLTDLLLTRLSGKLAQEARAEYPDVLPYQQKLGFIETDVSAAELTRKIIATLTGRTLGA